MVYVEFNSLSHPSSHHDTTAVTPCRAACHAFRAAPLNFRRSIRVEARDACLHEEDTAPV